MPVTLNVPPVLLVNVIVLLEKVPPVTTKSIKPVTVNVPPVLLVKIYCFVLLFVVTAVKYVFGKLFTVLSLILPSVSLINKLTSVLSVVADWIFKKGT